MALCLNKSHDEAILDLTKTLSNNLNGRTKIAWLCCSGLINILPYLRFVLDHGATVASDSEHAINSFDTFVFSLSF